MFSCFAEDLGAAIYKQIESTALFAVNQASTRARISSSGCDAPPLNKSPTERKYTFCCVIRKNSIPLKGLGACNIVTPSFAQFVSFSRSLISKESMVSRVLTNHSRVFGHYGIWP
jgi:hypothetical protein